MDTTKTKTIALTITVDAEAQTWAIEAQALGNGPVLEAVCDLGDAQAIDRAVTDLTAVLFDDDEPRRLVDYERIVQRLGTRATARAPWLEPLEG